MNSLTAELVDLQDKALEQAESLAAVLQLMSNLFWADGDDAPLFRATEEVKDTLRSIDLILAMPISEIEAAM